MYIKEDTNNQASKVKNMINSMKGKNINVNQISDSKGVIKSYLKYNALKNAIEILKDSGNSNIYNNIIKSLDSYSDLYSKAYAINYSLIKNEYESAVYLLSTCLSYDLAGYIINDKSKNKLLSDLIKELNSTLSNKNHKEYLENLFKIYENHQESISVLNESFTSEALEFIKTFCDVTSRGWKMFTSTLGFTARTISNIKSSFFGIIPLIRYIVYLNYKNKANTILNLEDQIQFIKLNIETLKNRKNIDEEKKSEIIKKQEAYVEAMKKKAMKLRAELEEAARDTLEQVKEDESKKAPSDGNDDDFILEGIDLDVYKND